MLLIRLPGLRVGRCASATFADHLNDYTTQVAFLCPAFHSINETDLALPLFTGVPILDYKSARQRLIVEDQGTMLLVTCSLGARGTDMPGIPRVRGDSPGADGTELQS